MQLFSDPRALLGPSEQPVMLSMSEVIADAREAKLGDSTWSQDVIRGTIKENGKKYEARVVDSDAQAAQTIWDAFASRGIKLEKEKPPAINNILSILSVIAFPLMIGLMIWFLVLRPAQMGGNQALNFGRSKAKRVGESGPKITFDDVAGIDEAKQELFEIVDFLKNTKKYAALGAKIPKGILLTGPPGVGKTHLARAIAGEAGVPFFHISGSDFVEMFVGVGAARVRDLFETAKAHRPSLIFIDEIDAVGRQRGAGLGGGHDEREQTLNQMLVEMDGFDPNSGVIMIAATNRPDVLDPALLRPGRFDRQIVVDSPDQPGRLSILKIHAKGKPFESNINMETLAKRTPGFTGADLANMLNEGALLAARRGHAKIQQEDLDEALDRVIAGPQRKSRIMDGKEREVIAYHEAGHAVIGELLENCDPVHKVTILPRGMSLGSTWHVPEADKFLVSREELEDDITALLGGRVAEESVYSKVWTGASNDLERVTRIARAMVCEYGMSEKLGTLALGRRSHNPFLGRDYHDERNYSEDVAKMIDEEVREIVDRCHRRATDILLEHRHQLDAVVHALLERETLTREEFLAVMEGKPLPEVVENPPNDGGHAADDKESEKSRKPNVAPRFEPA
ncbi:MAG: cell division protein FtsH [Armatimonadetes bacterium 55-13]|nr:ATP-dependent zinc metalloprotease FtsH [Armatimonadota bacterium]OJU65179.1 MAG: cell division protein FtsH [Armatimonadetes bacterium 55-13]